MNERWLRIALAVVAVAVLVVLVATTASSTVTFDPYNPDWNGTSEFRALAAEQGSAELITDASAYDGLDADRSVVFVLAPEQPHYARSGQAMQSYMDRGGTVVVAGDRGRSADWLVQNLTRYRIDRTPVRDLAAFTEGTALPLVHPPADRPIDGVDSVATNLPGSIDNVPDEQRVLVTASTAFRDADGDGEPDDDEPLGPFTVAATQSVGDGRMIVLADPSLFIDSMLDRADNRAFVTHLFGDADRVVIDRSHATSGRPPLYAALDVLRSSPAAQILVFGAVAIGLAAIVGWTRR
ncbi:DUF4350 domain-containing protein [Halococcoides cellulosivorans]|uniref:DUF4350 domain-containing protein n=1 Tax=Halococcoides cellulosivorans TaxID=1679096 RepID=A0A2R4X428_9EURY|nr:DUF4350 domain-containing protein [Halococcoides cellulosivorans]AWB28555.1 DUF4350 domain-containing protein [Halococcoides cellulosivorans]